MDEHDYQLWLWFQRYHGLTLTETEFRDLLDVVTKHVSVSSAASAGSLPPWRAAHGHPDVGRRILIWHEGTGRAEVGYADRNGRYYLAERGVTTDVTDLVTAWAPLPD